MKKKILTSDPKINPKLMKSISETKDIPFLIDPHVIDETITGFENKQNIINELREIGIDGILICLFLIKNAEVFCSARNIFRSINLPQTTGYRHIRKLTAQNYIHTRHTLDNPQKNYFQLTTDGKFLVYDLYKIIKY